MNAPTIDGGTLLTLLIALVVAVNQFRLLRPNRRKVIAEGSDLSTQAADRMLKHWEQDNKRLRDDNQLLKDRLDAVERRCDRFEALLREHDIPVPSID